MDTTPSTELDAVNVILQNMGEAPVNSLEGDPPLDALKAQNVLAEISEAVQTRGWFWNREVSTFTPNGSDQIPLPNNTLAIKGFTKSPYLTMRDGLLYRIMPNNNGDTFTDPVQIEITYFLDFADMPPVARRYVTMKAARVFQARELGNDGLARQDTAEEQTAWADMRAEENQNSGRSLKEANSVAKIVDRRRPFTGY